MPPLRVVLVRPRNPENLGAVARAMANFELDDWAIVAIGTHDFAAARRVAVHAEALLDRPRLCRTLDEAVADCAWVVGTSGRPPRGRRRLSPEEVAREAAARAPGRTAIVFGEERSGLTAPELERCHDLSCVPTGTAQPSLNLAQAVLLYAWEARRAAGRAPAGRAPAQASDAELSRLEEALRHLLRAGRFLAGPERHAVRDLAAVLRRGRPSPREARLWETALRAVAGRLAPAPGPRHGDAPHSVRDAADREGDNGPTDATHREPAGGTTMALDLSKLDLRDALDLAILIEEEARQRYEEFTKLVGGRYPGDTDEIFRMMASYEAKHEAQLKARRRSLFAEAPVRVSMDMIDDVEAPDRGAARVFMSPRQAVEVAMAAEEKAWDFFDRALKEVKDAEVRALFTELRDEEAEHKRLLAAKLKGLPAGPDLTEADADEPGSDAG